MGCNQDWLDKWTLCPGNELPCHEVYLDAYAIDVVEVAIGEYAECVTAEKCDPAQADRTIGWPSQAPAVCMDWEDAAAYCEFRGKRLPTEAEWERAARGDTSNRFPWGNEPPSCDIAMFGDDDNIDCCGTNTPQPVGSKPLDRSPFGVYDMCGSVEEWLLDWYDPDYYKVGPHDNPKGPASQFGSNGRSFRSYSYSVRATPNSPWRHSVSVRNGILPVKNTTTGIRCVRPR